VIKKRKNVTPHIVFVYEYIELYSDWLTEILSLNFPVESRRLYEGGGELRGQPDYLIGRD